MGKKEASENVQVVVRCRPMSKREVELKTKDVVTSSVADNQVVVNLDGEIPKTFSFDQIYNKQFSQYNIYLQTIHPLVESVLAGYNATVFAYGQSGTGKTHTMTGVIGTPEQGVIPNALQHVFNSVQADQDTGSKKQYSLHVSYLELYNGRCRDLLTDTKKNLELKENEHKLFYVKDLEKVVVTSSTECMRLMLEGTARREVGSTHLNQDSSRSHSVFTLEVACHNTEEEPATTVVSKLNLVDLAGSERQTKTAAEGDRLKEGSNINLSLSALGTVIDVLVKGKGHIPFRSSPLTMLLKDSLGGTSRTVMFATISPSEMNSSETLSTLRFADRAKRIKNKPRVQMDPKDALIQQLRDEVSTLKARCGGKLDESEDDAVRLEEMQVEVCNLKEEISILQSDMGKTEARLKAATEDAEAQHVVVTQLTEELKLNKETSDDSTVQLVAMSSCVYKFMAGVLPSAVLKEWKAHLKGVDFLSEAIPTQALENGLAKVTKFLGNPHAEANRCDSPNGNYGPHTPSVGLSSPLSSDEHEETRKRRSSSKKRKKKKSSTPISPPDMAGESSHELPASLTPDQQSAVEAVIQNLTLAFDKERKKLTKQTKTSDSSADCARNRGDLISKFMAVEEKLEAALVEKDGTLEELTKSRVMLEKVKKQVSVKTQLADDLKRETSRLMGCLKEAEEMGKRSVEEAQNKLIAENNRRHEQLLNLHQQELMKVRKQGTDSKKKIKKIKDANGELEQLYDQKVVEYNQLMRDFEGLKIQSMKNLREREDSKDERLWPVNQNTIKLTSIASNIMKGLSVVTAANGGGGHGGGEEIGVRPAKSAPMLATYGKSPEVREKKKKKKKKRKTQNYRYKRRKMLFVGLCQG